VSWLVSSDAGYVTGQTIGVNGGVWLKAARPDGRAPGLGDRRRVQDRAGHDPAAAGRGRPGGGGRPAAAAGRRSRLGAIVNIASTAASADAAYLTATAIPADGGSTAI
jgi:hypothetical protein